MAKIIIFGLSDLSELAHYYFTHDSDHEVVAFSVNKKYLEKKEFLGLPVVPYENIENALPPNDFKFFAPLTGRNMNKNRENIYIEVKQKGYELVSYISSKATVWPGAKIGDNCFIFEDNTIQPFTTIGNNVVLWSGNHIGHHGHINDHVFFTSHVVLSGHCNVDSYCYFGVNSTIKDGLHIAEGSLVAMGANLTKDTEAWGVYMGNPAKKGPKPSYDVY
jgi:sugar O-acyltransferase (sialic acid O-acetyltransferase NeuD family)